MSLIEKDLFGHTNDKVKMALARLKEFEPQDQPYYLAFSGGKDSIIIKRLAGIARVKYESVYNVTTIDPPELIYFMRQYHPDVHFDFPPEAFLTRLLSKGFPMRQNRWCCKEFKERGGSGRRVITGVRWAESLKRRKRRILETCYQDETKTFVNPIIDWTDADVWEFIHQEKMPYCKLYDEGWKRIGCLFCPYARAQRKRHVLRYPGYVKAFIHAFNKLYEKRKQNPKSKVVARWKNGEEMFWWWINSKGEKQNPDQRVMFE